ADVSNDEIDLRTTSSPIPAGSPAVIPMVACMRGNSVAAVCDRRRSSILTLPAVIDRRYSLRLVDFLVLVFLVHVLDVVLQDQEVRLTSPIHLDAVFVVPFDDALNNFAVLQNDDHRRLVLHLFYIIKVLSVGLIVGLRL